MALSVLGFTGALTGLPTGWKSMLVLGFISACLLAFVCTIDSLVPGFAVHPAGLSVRWRWLKRLDALWKKSVALLWIAIIPCAVIMLILSFPVGGPEYRPILARQDVYRLKSGQRATVVSRAKYIVVGVVFHSAFTLGVIGLDLGVLYKVAFGQMPFRTMRSKGIKKLNDEQTPVLGDDD